MEDIALMLGDFIVASVILFFWYAERTRSRNDRLYYRTLNYKLLTILLMIMAQHDSRQNIKDILDYNANADD